MKNVLGIVGSPRRGANTHILVRHVLDGAAQAGAATDLVFLADLDIRECDGCHACWRGKPCPRNDDMNGLYARLADSDAFVLGTPVYWYGPTALMKAFLDRLVYFNCPRNRPKIRGKSAVLAVPFEEKDPRAAGLLVTMLRKSLDYLEVSLVGKALAPGVTHRREVLGRPALLEEARELGRKAAGRPAQTRRGARGRS